VLAEDLSSSSSLGYLVLLAMSKVSNDVDKWQRYYSSGDVPPWESTKPHSGLEAFVESRQCPIPAGGSVCELGAGASASAQYMSDRGFHTTAIDIAPLAKERFELLYGGSDHLHKKVNYITGDFLDLDGKGEVERKLRESVPVKWAKNLATGENVDTNVEDGYFDFIFDLQCFHVTRDIDEYAHVEKVFQWVRPGGYVMVVTGATPEHSELGLEQLSVILNLQQQQQQQQHPRNNSGDKMGRTTHFAASASAFAVDGGGSVTTLYEGSTKSIRLPPRPSVPGPPRLYRQELTEPFIQQGFTLVDCRLTNFNSTPTYLKMSNSEASKALEESSGHVKAKKGLMPLAWQALFYKPSYEDLVHELRS
jgi:hypothetical protein